MRELDLSGKHALVTGASRGIGAVIAEELARAGAHVFIAYRANDECAQRTRAAIEGAGGSATVVRANLVDAADVTAMFEMVKERGPLDILVHSAAIGSFKQTMSVRANQWDLTLDVNAKALLSCAQHAAPLMAGRGGKIVALSSLGGTRVVPGYGAIGVAKGAVESLVRYLGVELAAQGINVNAVAGGLIDSPSIRQHPAFASLAARTRELTPSARLGTPQDLANVVLFLCSPLANWIVGQTIVVDGGASLPA